MSDKSSSNSVSEPPEAKTVIEALNLAGRANTLPSLPD